MPPGSELRKSSMGVGKGWDGQTLPKWAKLFMIGQAAFPTRPGNGYVAVSRLFGFTVFLPWLSAIAPPALEISHGPPARLPRGGGAGGRTRLQPLPVVGLALGGVSIAPDWY